MELFNLSYHQKFRVMNFRSRFICAIDFESRRKMQSTNKQNSIISASFVVRYSFINCLSCELHTEDFLEKCQVFISDKSHFVDLFNLACHKKVGVKNFRSRSICAIDFESRRKMQSTNKQNCTISDSFF